MAKHPHRLLLMNKKTWRCTLEGCAFFVHLGLAHVLLGKRGICWECGDEFTIDEAALKDDTPFCYDCRMIKAGMEDRDKETERKIVLAKQGVVAEDDLTDLQRSMLEMLGKLPPKERK